MTRWFEDRDHQILTAILLIAFALRAWGLNSPLWYDEITTIETHLRLPWDEMMTSYSMNHHYLFSLQAKLSSMLFGEAPWSVRLPAMLFGVGSIAAIWVLAKRVAGAPLAHLVALLLALSYHHIWFSQNARGYTELAFWSTLGMIFFLRGMQEPRLKVWLAYSVCLALAVATHLTGFFFFAAQGIVWLIYSLWNIRRLGLLNDKVKYPAIGYLVGGVLALAFYAPVLSGVFETASSVSETSSVDVMREYQSPLWAVVEAFRTIFGSMGRFLVFIAISVIAVSLVGAFKLGSTSPFFAPTVGIHIALTMALLLALGMRIWPRFFFVDIGFLMLLIVVGVHGICKWIGDAVLERFSGLVFPAAALAMILLSAGLASRNYLAPKQDMAGAVSYVTNQLDTSSRIYAIGVAGPLYNSFYGANWETVSSPEEFAAALSQSEPTYFVVTFPSRSFRLLPAMDAMAETGGLQLVKRLPGTLGDGNILIFKRL